MDQHIFYNGARFFEQHGMSSFRFNLYAWENDARKLGECTLETHAFDLDRVISYFRKKKVKKVFVVGHSFGGPAILASHKKDFDGVIFWDASYGNPFSFKGAQYIKVLRAYRAKWEFDVLLNKKMVEEGRNLQSLEEKAVKSIRVPMKIITAGANPLLVKAGKRYYQLANEPKEYVVLGGAGHTFDEDGVAEKLFRETVNLVKKHAKTFKRRRSL